MTRTRSSAAISRSRYGRQLSRSTGVGLLSGGAQRFTAAMYVSMRRSPSSRRRDTPLLESPAP
jgi:hypothetical protein